MTHTNKRPVIKLRIEKCIHKYTHFSQFHIRGQSCQSIQFSIGSLRNGNDVFTPSSFFEFEFQITASDISKLNASVLLRSK